MATGRSESGEEPVLRLNLALFAARSMLGGVHCWIRQASVGSRVSRLLKRSFWCRLHPFIPTPHTLVHSNHLLSKLRVCLQARTHPERRQPLHPCKRARRTRFPETLTASHLLVGPSLTDCFIHVWHLLIFLFFSFIRLMMYFVSCSVAVCLGRVHAVSDISVTAGTYSFTGTFPPVTGCTVAHGSPSLAWTFFTVTVPLLSIISRSPKFFPRALNLAARLGNSLRVNKQSIAWE